MSATNFLHSFSRGPYHLVAIEEGRGLTAKTFDANQAELMSDWIARKDGAANLYFHPARLNCRNKKARIEDVESVDYLWVDIDPRVGENLEDEQARIQSLLSQPMPNNIPTPTFVVFSGGGYQVFWRLVDSLSAEEAGSRNRVLANILDGDNCGSADHLMRLPGTINVPDLRKRKKGRLPVKAELVLCQPNDSHPSESFPTPPQKLQTKATPKPVVIDSIERITDLKTLDLPGRIETIIGIGRVPDEGPKAGDDSRSGWLFDAVCGMVRAGLPDGVIYSVITDSQWKISESILDKPKSEEYAKRQIENARQVVDADFVVDAKGRPTTTPHNVRVALQKLGVSIRHNQFSGRMLLTGLKGFGPVISDGATVRLRLLFQERYQLRYSKSELLDILMDVGYHNSFHPVREYYDSLVWDKVPRLDSWLNNYCGAENNEFHSAIGKIVFVAAVKRIKQPGTKFDEMLVLESEQGLGKSTMLRALCPDPDWFTDALDLGADAKSQIEQISGHLIIECADLAGMRKGDVDRLKSFLSRRVDKGRMAYQRVADEFPRQCVLIGTSNNNDYLKDNTGNRRFWPVHVNKIDIEAIKRDRDQLWAEAVHLEQSGEPTRLDPLLWPVAGDLQKRRVQEALYVQTFRDRLPADFSNHWFWVADAWAVLGIGDDRRTQQQNMALGTSMRQLGFSKKRRKNPSTGKLRYVYFSGKGETQLTPHEGGGLEPATGSPF